MVALPPEIGAQTGGEHEHRRTEMCDPPREEERRRSLAEILGRKGHRSDMEEVARVIQRHDRHDEPAKSVDGRKSRTRLYCFSARFPASSTRTIASTS